MLIQNFSGKHTHINPGNGTLFLAGRSGLIMIEPGKLNSFPPPKAYIRAIRCESGIISTN
jgi:hypothetical protein